MIILEIDPDLTKYNQVIYATAKVMTTNRQKKKTMWKEKIEKVIKDNWGKSVLTELQQGVNVRKKVIISNKLFFKEILC